MGRITSWHYTFEFRVELNKKGGDISVFFWILGVNLPNLLNRPNYSYQMASNSRIDEFCFSKMLSMPRLNKNLYFTTVHAGKHLEII